MLTVHNVPIDLRGTLTHVTITLPASYPVHGVGVYIQPGQRMALQAALAYIKALQDATATNPAIMAGGDWNATLCPASDRQDGHATACDTMLSAITAGMSWTTMLPSHRMHTYIHPTTSTTSRIDDWLCNVTSTCMMATKTIPQYPVRATFLHGSDHHPLHLTLPYTSLFQSGPIPMHPPLPNNPNLILPIPQDVLMHWRSTVQCRLRLSIGHASRHIDRLLCSNPVKPTDFLNVSSTIDSILHEAFDIALRMLRVSGQRPCRTQHNTPCQRTKFLPRALGKRCKHEKSLMYKYQSVCKTINAHLASGTPAALLHERLIATLFGEQATHTTVQSWERIQRTAKDLMSTHRQEMNSILADDCKRQERKAFSSFQATWSRSQKRAKQLIFQSTNNNTGVPTPTLHALHHPLKGHVSDPPLVAAAARYHFLKPMSPKLLSTPALISTYPWEGDHALDRFTLLQRARANPFDNSVSNPTLEVHLTHAMYHTCLRSMPRGTAPGPNGIPNEILQHLPEEAHEMLLGFFKLCWRARCTPPSWKHSNTLLFHKKGSPLHASNYRPIALHNNIFKFWTKIITNILQDFAEQQGILHAGQEGFRHHKSTGRQLQLLTQTLEDAKLSRKN